MSQLHPSSIDGLRQLIKLHGHQAVLQAINEITQILASRGRPPKLKPSTEPTVGEAIEDVRDALKNLRAACDMVELRILTVRELNKGK
jgi:hypothetical protein